MFGKKKQVPISHNAAEFYDYQYTFAMATTVKYLNVWFKQIFSAPEYKKMFDGWDNVSEQMALAVASNLLGGIENKSPDSNYKRALTFAPKWADDAMNRDEDFRKLVVQTARLDNIYQTFLEGDNWYETKKGGKITINTIEKYGGDVLETPNPETYKKLLEQWLVWVRKANTLED